METIILPRVEQERSLARVIAFLSALPKNKAWKLTISELRGDRSDRQNNALHGVAYPPLCEAIGCTKYELHHIMCERFFGTKSVMGRELPRRTTTTNEDGKRDVISWDEFSKFYAMVQQIGAEMPNPIWIPDPDKSLRTR